MTADTKLAIGIDLGATKIAAALVNRHGDLLATRRRLTASGRGVEMVLNDLAELISELLEVAPKSVAGIGIGSPGQIDPDSGIVRRAVNLDWHEVALEQEIQNRLKVEIPIFIQKDANAEVLGEAYFGAGQGCKDLVYIGIGSGLGGGAMVDGRLVIGNTFNASEIGHFSLDPDGRVCQCGARGCAETVVSGPGIIVLARDYLAQQTYSTNLSDSPELTPDIIIRAAHDGDPLAQAVLDEVARWLGFILAAYVAILNPARIVIGGGLGRAAYKLLAPKATAEVRRRVLKQSCQQLQIVQSQLASSAVGASCLIWQSQLKA